MGVEGGATAMRIVPWLSGMSGITIRGRAIGIKACAMVKSAGIQGQCHGCLQCQRQKAISAVPLASMVPWMGVQGDHMYAQWAQTCVCQVSGVCPAYPVHAVYSVCMQCIQRVCSEFNVHAVYRTHVQGGPEKTTVSLNGSFVKRTACSSYVQPWLVAIGGWRRLVVVGGGW